MILGVYRRPYEARIHFLAINRILFNPSGDSVCVCLERKRKGEREREIDRERER